VPTFTYKFLVFTLQYLPRGIINALGKLLAPGRYDKQ